jgi:putative two-component system response regulator
MAEMMDAPDQTRTEYAAGQGSTSLICGDAGLLPNVRNCRILIVDPSPAKRKVVRGNLLPLEHQLIEASSTTQAFEIVRSGGIDLVLADVMVPDLGGSAFCRVLRNHLDTRLIPIFLLADNSDPDQEASGIAAGADDFLVRPLQPKTMQARVQATLRQKAMLESVDEAESVLFSLGLSVEARDAAIGQHCQRLATLSSSIGVALGLPATDLLALQRAGYLHDVGKVAVPDSVLFKTGPLTPQEWAVMKQHTIRGEQICSGMKSLRNVLPIIRHHHERWDGSGYPDGLAGEKIPLLARIVQIADIYDALTTHRSYKPAYTPEHALEILQDEARAGWRDPVLVKAFASTFPFIRNSEILVHSSLQALSAALEQTKFQLIHMR